MDEQSRPDDEADWSQLPRNPVSFFGLTAGFDVRDLKRAYNRLLRRYKPEKHPEEFQRIRSAYEALDQGLRYGTADAAESAGSWTEPLGQATLPGGIGAEHAGAASDKAPEQAVPVDPLEALAERLEMTGASPTEEYSRLRGLPVKTPADYYALALLGDAIKPAGQHPFVQWLLKGVEEHPEEGALARLLYGYLATQAPEEMLAQILFACAKQIRGDAFYRITEGAWDRVLRGDRAYRFAPLLRKCEAARAEQEGGDPTIAGRVAFTLHALRYALWKDQTGWGDEALEFLEANFDQMPPHLEHELDNLAFVREYIACRGEFVASHPLCARMDETLEAAFIADPVEADRRMLRCQQELAEKEEEVAEAFPCENSPLHSAFFSLWSWVSEDTAARIASPGEEEVDQQFWYNRVHGMLFDLKQKFSLTAYLRKLIEIARGVSVFGVFFVLFIGPFALFLSLFIGISSRPLKDSPPGFSTLALWISMATGAIVAYQYWERFAQFNQSRIWGPVSNRVAKRCYRLQWRPRLLEFVRQSSLDFFLFRGIIDRIASVTDGEYAWLSHFVQQDFGLAVSALAQKFRS